MKTTNDDFSSPRQPDLTPRVPRLPGLPASRWEGTVFLVLGLASVAMYWFLLAAIIQFVPRAEVFAGRVRQAPELLVSPAYALRAPEIPPGERANTPLAAEPGTSRHMSNTTAACREPVG